MTDVPTFTIITNQLHVGRYTVFASPMDPTGIPSFLANLFGVFVLYLGSNPGRWTCGFRWALFGKALPKKFAEKHLAFAEVSKRMSRKTCEDVDLYNSKKKKTAGCNSWLKTNDLQGVEWSLFSCLFFRMIRSFLYLKFWESACDPQEFSSCRLESLDTPHETRNLTRVLFQISTYTNSGFLKSQSLVVPLLLPSMQKQSSPKRKTEEKQ